MESKSNYKILAIVILAITAIAICYFSGYALGNLAHKILN